jgi:hypothetical protein
MIRLSFGLLALCLLSNSAWAQRCVDVRHFDFKNATIRVGTYDENELQTLFNSRSPFEYTFHLHDGIAYLSDDPGSLKSHDWQVDLLEDREVHPDPRTWLHVIVLDRDHLTGTGTWYYVLAFSCNNGHLIRQFQFSSGGVILKSPDDQTLHLYQTIWALNDSHADPSGERELVYKWNAKEHRYRRVPTISGNGVKSVPDKK